MLIPGQEPPETPNSPTQKPWAQFAPSAERFAVRVRGSLLSTYWPLWVLLYSMGGTWFDLWPMNWIRALIEWRNHYDFSHLPILFSGIISSLLLLLASYGLESWLSPILSRLDRVIYARPKLPEQPLQEWQVTFRVGIGLTLTCWLIAFVSYGYAKWREASDNAAMYRPVSVADLDTVTASYGEHLSLQGKVIGQDQLEFYLASRYGSSSRLYGLVPLVSAQWHEGNPVHWVLYIDSIATLPGYSSRKLTWQLSQPVLGRVITRLPLSLRLAMGRLDAPLASDYRVLRVLESENGVRLIQQGEYRPWLLVFGGIATFILLVSTLSGASKWNDARRKLKGK